MIKLLAVGLGLAILGPLCAQPVLSQSETFIGLPTTTASTSTSAFSRWQQINVQPEATDPELEGVVIKTQAEEEAALEENPEGSLNQMMNVMQSLPVRVDYTGVGLIYERSY